MYYFESHKKSTTKNKYILLFIKKNQFCQPWTQTFLFYFAPPPLDFQKLKRKNTVIHNSNRKRDKEVRRLRKKKKYIVPGVIMAKEPLPLSPYPSKLYQFIPFSPFFIRNRKQNTIFSPPSSLPAIPVYPLFSLFL